MMDVNPVVSATLDVVVKTLRWQGAAATVRVVGPDTVRVEPARAHGAPVNVRVGRELIVEVGVGIRIRVAADALEELSSIVTIVASGQLTERLGTRGDRTVSRGAAVGDNPLRVLGVNTSIDWLFGKKTSKVTYPAYPPGTVTLD
jgi:hypothetical protein